MRPQGWTVAGDRWSVATGESGTQTQRHGTTILSTDHRPPRTARPTLIVMLLLGLGAAAFAQQPKPPTTPDEIVQEWLRRWAQLDGSDASAARFVELYAENGVHETGPSQRQLGTVYYEGHSDIRHMARSFGQANGEITFRIAATVGQEKSAELVHLAQGPWGGASVAFEYVAAYTSNSDKKRVMAPGAAFLEISNGKIRKSRLYTAREETMTISP